MADWDICGNEGEIGELIPTSGTTSAAYIDTTEARYSTVFPTQNKIPFPSAETRVSAFLRYATANTSSQSYAGVVTFYDASDNILASLQVAPNFALMKLQGMVSSVLTTFTETTTVAQNQSLTPHLKFVLDTALGVLELHVNGGIALKATVDASSTPIAYAKTANAITTTYFNTLAFSTKNRALTQIYSKYPTATGLDVDGGGAWTDIDDILASGVDVTTFSAAGQRRSVKSNAPAIVKNIAGFHVTCYALREDATGPQNIRPYVKISGTRYFGPTFALSLASKPYTHNFAVNPATSLAWTTAVLNDATFEYGWEAVA